MGTLQTNPPTLPNTVADSWQPLVERDALGYAGMNKITLTNWDETTTIPQLAQGSIIDIDGSLATFAVDEAIGGTPADGTVYLKFVVSGSTVTPEFTAESPTWYADKAGWYNASGERFSGHNCSKAGTAYTNKSRFMDEVGGDSRQLVSDGTTYAERVYSDGGFNSDNVALRCKKFSGTLGSTGGAQFAHGLDWTKIQTLTVAFYRPSDLAWYTFYFGSSAATFQAEIRFTSTDIILKSGISDFNNQPYRVMAFYEA